MPAPATRGAILDGHQSVAQRRQRAGALAVRPLRRDITDQQTKEAGDKRGEDFLVELGQIEQRCQREEKGCQASGARQHCVADFLGSCCGHWVRCASGGRKFSAYTLAVMNRG